MRAEFLSKRPAFSDLRVAQQALDEWVDYYNTARPHQLLDIGTKSSTCWNDQCEYGVPGEDRQ